MKSDPIIRRFDLGRLGVTLIGLGLLCGCASHEPPVSTSGMAHPRAAGELRVMTFNLRVRKVLDGSNIWDLRRDLVVERIRDFDADLVGTQEGLDFMETFLREKLGDYTFFGAGRDDGSYHGEMCGVFFKTAHFKQLDGGHFWLSPTPDQPGSRGWCEINPRITTWVKLRPRDGGPDFCWFNTHFDAWSPWARTESAKLMHDRLPRIAGTLPYIVTGDFNSVPGSAPYRALLAEREPPVSSLHDAFRAAHPVVTHQEGTFHSFSGQRTGRRLDWILASGQFETIAAEIDRTRGPGGYPSDHFPVTATLRFRAAIPVTDIVPAFSRREFAPVLSRAE